VTGQSCRLTAIGDTPDVAVVVGGAAGQQAAIRVEDDRCVALDAASDQQPLRPGRQIPQADPAAAHVDRQQGTVRAVSDGFAGAGRGDCADLLLRRELPELYFAAEVDSQGLAIGGEGQARDNLVRPDQRWLDRRADIRRRIEPHAHRTADGYRLAVPGESNTVGGAASQADQLHKLSRVIHRDWLPAALGQPDRGGSEQRGYEHEHPPYLLHHPSPYEMTG